MSITALRCPNCESLAPKEDLEPCEWAGCSRCSAWIPPVWDLGDFMECPACGDIIFTCPKCNEWAEEGDHLDAGIECPECEEVSPAANWEEVEAEYVSPAPPEPEA